MDEVELRDLRVLFVCAEELNFARAAQSLGLTPGRVSQIIAKLERQLGGAIFERTSRRVALTAWGIEVVDEIGPHYRGLQAAVSEVTRTRTGVAGVLRVGMYGMAWGRALVPIVAELQRCHPRCSVQRIDLGLNDPVGRLQRGEVDVVAVYLPVNQLGVAVGPIVARHSRSVLLAEHHPLAVQESVTWDEIAKYSVSAPVFLPEPQLALIAPPCTPSGQVLHRSLRVNSFNETLAAVAAGSIVHPTISGFVDYVGYPGIVGRPIQDGEPLSVAVVYREQSPSSAVQAFLAAAARAEYPLAPDAKSGRAPHGPQ